MSALDLEDVTGFQRSLRQKRVRLAESRDAHTVSPRNRVQCFTGLHFMLFHLAFDIYRGRRDVSYAGLTIFCRL